MTRTEELLALAEAANRTTLVGIANWGKQIDPETIKQMCLREQKLVESTSMLKDALSAIARGCNSSDPASIIARDALEAFNNFERNL